MRCRFFVWWLVGCFAAVFSGPASAQLSLRIKENHLVVGDSALFLERPVVYGFDEFVESMSWSYDSRYLLIVSSFQPKGKTILDVLELGQKGEPAQTPVIQRLWLLDRLNRKFTKLAEFEGETIGALEWAISSKAIFLAVSKSEQEFDVMVMGLDGRHSNPVRQNGLPMFFSANKKRDSALIVSVVQNPIDQKKFALRGYIFDGTDRLQPMPDNPETKIQFEGFRQGSDSIYGHLSETVNGRRKRSLFELPPPYVKWQRSDRKDDDGILNSESLTLEVTNTTIVYVDVSNEPVYKLVLGLSSNGVSDEGAIIGPWIPLGTGYQVNAVSCTNTFVAHDAPGCIVIRPIRAIPKAKVEEALNVTPKDEAVNVARQFALAILLFADDNDGRLPEAATFADVIMPYLRQEGLLSQFNFVYDGVRKMEDIKDPASTILGYVSAPGGRAIAYADGHVKWFPDEG